MSKQLNKQAMELKQSGIRSATVRCNELGGINLGQGVCDLPIKHQVKEAACHAIQNNKNLYSYYGGVRPLRESIANKVADFNGINVDPGTQVMVTHGATGAYVAAMKLLLNPGDEVILFEPFYGYHKHVVELFSGVVKAVPLSMNDLSFSEQALRATITEKTKALVLCTPNNPTGKVFSEQELTLIGELAKEHDFYVVCDEMYEYFTYPGYEHISLASMADYFDRTITLSGFSKIYNMTGWRLGYAYGPEALIRQMGLIHDFLYVCPVTPLQYGVVEAMQQPASYYDAVCEDFLEKRDYITDALAELGFEFVIPQGAYYLLANGQGFNLAGEGALSAKLLEQAKVATVPGSAFYLDQSRGVTELRFCFAHELPILQQAVAQLQAVL